jgi:hypothetical protein
LRSRPTAANSSSHTKALPPPGGYNNRMWCSESIHLGSKIEGQEKELKQGWRARVIIRLSPLALSSLIVSHPRLVGLPSVRVRANLLGLTVSRRAVQRNPRAH